MEQKTGNVGIIRINMIYSIAGTVALKKENFAVVEAGGIGYKIFISKITHAALPPKGETAKMFCHQHVREDQLDLYGFLSEEELELFLRLISVSGIGPKSGLAIMGVAGVGQLVAAINEGKMDLLTKVSGVGKKTAERVVLELKGKLVFMGDAGPQTLSLMESDLELEETLCALGFSKAQARAAIAKINPEVKGFKERLKEALRRKGM